MPWIIRLALIAAILVLSAGILYVGARGFGVVVGGVGSTLSGFVKGVTATPVARRPSSMPCRPRRRSTSRTEPYTSESSVDLVVTVPPALIGNTDHRIRLYLTLPGQQAAAITEVPIADAPKTVIPGIGLTDGINDFSVTITGPGGQSDPSAVVRYVFDDTPPKITITSPKNNAVVNGKAVTIKGKTQARTTLLARNDANGSSVAGTAESDGSFTLSVALATGVNKITITGTDPAGNAAQAVVSVRRGTGKLTVALSASTYNIKRSKLPEPVTLTATVTDPDGHALADAAGDVHPEHARHPDGQPGRHDQGRAARQRSRRRCRRVRTSAREARPSWSRPTAYGSAEDYTVITITK